MTIEVKLRKLSVNGAFYLVPTGITWHADAQRWNVRASKTDTGGRKAHCYPAARHGGVAKAFLCALDKLDELRQADLIETTTRAELQRHYATKSLEVGLDLDTQVQKTCEVHYIRASVGSLKAKTLRKKNFRVGVVDQYNDGDYQRVYAQAKAYRDKLVEEHLKEIRKLKMQSHRQARALIQKFMLDHKLVATV